MTTMMLDCGPSIKKIKVCMPLRDYISCACISMSISNIVFIPIRQFEQVNLYMQQQVMTTHVQFIVRTYLLHERIFCTCQIIMICGI